MASTKKASTNSETTSLRVSRVIKAPPERLYQAFLDPDALVKWMPPNGFTARVHKMEPRVGGSFRMSFSTINRSWTQYFGGKYLELVPNKKIVNTDKFETEDPNMQNEMTVTITFTPVKGGTEVVVVQENIPKGPAADGAPEGWKQSFDNLQRLCEAELPF